MLSHREPRTHCKIFIPLAACLWRVFPHISATRITQERPLFSVPLCRTNQLQKRLLFLQGSYHHIWPYHHSKCFTVTVAFLNSGGEHAVNWTQCFQHFCSPHDELCLYSDALFVKEKCRAQPKSYRKPHLPSHGDIQHHRRVVNSERVKNYFAINFCHQSSHTSWHSRKWCTPMSS